MEERTYEKIAVIFGIIILFIGLFIFSLYILYFLKLLIDDTLSLNKIILGTIGTFIIIFTGLMLIYIYINSWKQ